MRCAARRNEEFSALYCTADVASRETDAVGCFHVSEWQRTREDQKAKAKEREAPDMEVDLTCVIDTVMAFE